VEELTTCLTMAVAKVRGCRFCPSSLLIILCLVLLTHRQSNVASNFCVDFCRNATEATAFKSTADLLSPRPHLQRITRRRTLTLSRIPHQSGAISLFQLHLKSGDIHPNLGPTKVSIPSKIMESCVNDVIVDHVLKINHLVRDNQWAYRKGHSTELLLAHLTETWRHAVDSGLVVGVALVYFKKAFDYVNHEILLNKLQCRFGIRGPLLAWLTSYLTSRSQYTVLNGQRSILSHVSSSVPQGSVLGPTLFVLYTSDLVEFVQSATVYMYADDTTVYCIGESTEEVSAALNQSLKEL